MIKRTILRNIEDLDKLSLTHKIHRKIEEIKVAIQYRLCHHDYQAIDLAKVTTDDYGKTIYTYRMQCMKCGKISLFYRSFKEKQPIVLPYRCQSVLSKLRKGDLIEITTENGPDYCIWFCKRENGKIYGLEKDSREAVVVVEMDIAILEKNKNFKEYIKSVGNVLNSKEFAELMKE